MKNSSRHTWVNNLRNIFTKINYFFDSCLGWTLFISSSLFTILISAVFLIIFFYPKSSLLDFYTADFPLIKLLGILNYYSFIVSTFLTITLPLYLITLFSLSIIKNKDYIKLRPFLFGALVFCCSLFLSYTLHSSTKTLIEDEISKLQEVNIEKFYNINNFESIHISELFKFGNISIKQGEKFSIKGVGNEYSFVNLSLGKTKNNELFIDRSRHELTFYNSEFRRKFRKFVFHPKTKVTDLEVTMPDLEKLKLGSGNVKLVDLELDNLEVETYGRFNNVKGDIKIKNTLKMNTSGGIFNITGSAGNIEINSGDCWIELDRFFTKNASINAENTSRLNINVSDNLDIQKNINSGIVNHYTNK